MKGTLQIRKLTKEDWPEVDRIYQEGILTRNATFEKEVPSWDSWDSEHCEECRLVAETNGKVIGWASVKPISIRHAYRGVAEVSVYISESSQGKGVGSKLMENLIQLSEQNGYWTLQAGIFPENKASITLHKKFEFKEIGVRERVGEMDGKWRDVLLMERRSLVVGLDQC